MIYIKNLKHRTDKRLVCKAFMDTLGFKEYKDYVFYTPEYLPDDPQVSSETANRILKKTICLSKRPGIIMADDYYFTVTRKKILKLLKNLQIKTYLSLPTDDVIAYPPHDSDHFDSFNYAKEIGGRHDYFDSDIRR